jgi:dTDP-4-dehydrorhamnose 3,5-epimerase
MRLLPTSLPEVLVVQPDVHRDARGFFLESFNVRGYEAIGIKGPFVQDNHSASIAPTLRGLHLQLAEPQAKLVRVVAGEVFDVAVDVRLGSPTFGRWFGVRLSAENFLQCYVPEGFAHGFCVLSERAQVEYKVTSFYNPAGELGIAWNDSELGIEWPVERPLLSTRDAGLPRLADVMDRLPRYEELTRSGR